MNNLNTVLPNGTFGMAVSLINDNFSLIVNAINSLEYASTKSKGIHNYGFVPSTTTIPNAVSGDWCMVLGSGNTFPAQIWTFNGTSWSQGGTWNPEGLDLTDYATKTELNTAVANSVLQATALVGYYQCTVNDTTLAVTAPGFTLPANGGNIRIKMSAPATGASTLNINSTGPKTLLYNGAAVSSANTWEQNEIISVFYDPSGSGQYLASNSQGGGGKLKEGICNNSTEISIINNTNIPFKNCTYIYRNNVLSYLTNNKRLLIELPSKNIHSLRIINSSYIIGSAFAYRGSIPTNQYADITQYITNNTSINVEAALASVSGFVPNMVLVAIKTPNDDDLSGVTSVDNIISIQIKKDTNIGILQEKVGNDHANIAILTGNNIPFSLGSYAGINTGSVFYWDTNTRIRIELPVENLKLVSVVSSDYVLHDALMYNGLFPTSNFASIANKIVRQSFIDVENAISSLDLLTFTPDRVMIVLRKADSSELSSVTNIDNIVELTPINSTIKNSRTVRKIKLSGGSLNSSTGLYPPSLIYYMGYGHTPKFIKYQDGLIVKTRGISIWLCYYDEEQNFLGYSSSAIDTTDSEYTIPRNYPNTAYIRIAVRNTYPCPDYIEVEGVWSGNDDVFQKLPSDNGYQGMTFIVDIDTCQQPSSSVSRITQQYVKTTDSGVLHLPSNYNHNGKPTPLIIFIHGEGGRYKAGDTRFCTDDPLAPEWDAAGYAQMDIDTIPDYYNYERTGTTDHTTGGTSDDAKCIEAAYEWAISHFNIARDGVYLIGRSRGAQAVLQTLGRLNNMKVPVICAISNAGANSLINYEVYRNSSADEWALFCKAHGLPAPGTNGCPSYTSKARNNIGALISNSDIAAYLRSNINVWWGKALTGLPMLDKYPNIPVINNNDDEPFNVRLFDLIVESYKLSTTDANYGKAYCEWLRQCVMVSTIPLRFDWCTGDKIQADWDNPNKYVFGSACKDAFIADKITCRSIFRLWPTADTSGDYTDPHYHELMNFYDGNYQLPNGVVVTNPSMARLEWLLWCQRNDKRYNGSINPT